MGAVGTKGLFWSFAFFKLFWLWGAALLRLENWQGLRNQISRERWPMGKRGVEATPARHPATTVFFLFWFSREDKNHDAELHMGQALWGSGVGAPCPDFCVTTRRFRAKSASSEGGSNTHTTTTTPWV